MDVSGEEQMDTSHEIFKTRVDMWGRPVHTEREPSLGAGTAHGGKEANALVAKADPNYCGPCYGAEPTNGSKCCNTCEEVQEAYMSKGWVIQDIEKIEQCVKEGVSEKIKEQYKEGCNLHGTINVSDWNVFLWTLTDVVGPKSIGKFPFCTGKNVHLVASACPRSGTVFNPRL